MKRIALKVRDLALLYLKWAWPLLLADALLERWAGNPETAWRSCLNAAAFLWILCAPVAPLSLLLDRGRRERAMARLCGLREGDERERAVTGEAARTTLLLALSLEIVLLVLSLVSVHLTWDPNAPQGRRHTLLVSMGFSSSRHLDPFGAASEKDGFLLAPSTFPVLALLILVQLAAFRAVAVRQYEGADA